MSVHEYKLPDVGEGLTEAEIVTWKVEVGDVIAVNDVVVEIETAKSLVELPSPYAGTVTGLLVEEGQTVPVGTPIIAVDDGVSTGSTDGASPVEPVETPEMDLSNPAATGGGENQTLVGYGPRSGAAMRRARRGPATASTMAGSAAQMQVQGSFAAGARDTSEVVPADEPAVPATAARRRPEVPEPTDRPRSTGAWSVGSVLAKPSVRKLARDLGVDLRAIVPVDPRGIVSSDEVRAAAGGAVAQQRESAVEDRPAAAHATEQGGLQDRREPIKGVRKMMGQAMVSSAFTIPHVTEWVTVDVTRTMRLLSRLRDDRAFQDVRVSPLLVAARAVCLAMQRTPEVNAVWHEQDQEVVFRGAVNLGIAAATPRGLVVPNVKGADRMTLADLGRAINQVADVAREGRTQPADMADGTFTITNVGVFGVDGGTPIINPGESAILALGAVRRQPWVHKGKVKARDLTTVSLSFDHRFIDGAKGSQFLADVATILEDPARSLAW
jgi:2-oxoisovalerate dehydrogenase E2 component (dihydrolipoyl transacylase)